MKKLIVVIALCLSVIPALQTQADTNTIEALVVQKVHVPSTEDTIAGNVLKTVKNEFTAERWLVLITVAKWGGGLTTLDNKDLFEKVKVGEKTKVSYDMVVSFGTLNSCSYQLTNIALPNGESVNIYQK